jgi:hypothetical protein
MAHNILYEATSRNGRGIFPSPKRKGQLSPLKELSIAGILLHLVRSNIDFSLRYRV